MPSWRLARSLETLRNEVNARWPNRSKASDGTFGDAAHAATASDHNPNAGHVVCAFDITHDPDNGPDIGELFDLLCKRRHPDCKYLIANGRIASRRTGFSPARYTGDPHNNHIHVSVGVGPDGQSTQPYDDTEPWLDAAPSQPQPIDQEDDMVFIAEFADWPGQRWLVQPGNAKPPAYGTRQYIRDPDELTRLIEHGVRNIQDVMLGGTLYADVTKP